MTAALALVLLLHIAHGVIGDFVKGTFHQHAVQPYYECLRSPSDFPACGCCGCENKQDWFGVAADMVLESMANSGQGYDFVGLTGNEVPPFPPTHTHGFVVLNVTESQMAVVCGGREGDDDGRGEEADEGRPPRAHWPPPNQGHAKHGKCTKSCEPVVPEGSGPWLPAEGPHRRLARYVNRNYIQGVPGYWVLHPDWDPFPYYGLDYALAGDGNMRGLEIYNNAVVDWWDAEVPLDDAGIDPLYPQFIGFCPHYWDEILRTLKRPIYGMADDDGFIQFVGDTWTPVYPHTPQDTMQTYSAAWFRFGAGWSMVEVPSRRRFTARDVSEAIDGGRFYASTGVSLEYDLSAADAIHVKAAEPVVFAATGGGGEEGGGAPLTAFNVTLCADRAAPGRVTNVGCEEGERGASRRARAPPAARELLIDLDSIPAEQRRSFYYVRVQARVLRRYTITSAPTPRRLDLVSSSSKSKMTWGANCAAWEFVLDTAPLPEDLWEGRFVWMAGVSARRLLLVSGVEGRTVSCVSCFNENHTLGYGTPNSGNGQHTTIEGIVAGEHQLFTQRWAWLQPVWRHVDAGTTRHIR